MNASHSDHDVLMAGGPPSREPAPPAADAGEGSAADSQDAPAAGAETLEDAARVGGGEGAMIEKGDEGTSPLDMAARGLSQGTGLATMNAASAFVN